MTDLRDQLLGRKPKTVAVPVAGVDGLFVRELSAKAVGDAMKTLGDDQDTARQGALLVSVAACDKDGNQIFSPTDVDAILEMPAGTLAELASAASAVNGFDEAGK
jgi:hypothetical protein